MLSTALGTQPAHDAREGGAVHQLAHARGLSFRQPQRAGARLQYGLTAMRKSASKVLFQARKRKDLPRERASPVRSEDARRRVVQSSSPGQWQMPDAWRPFDRTTDQGGQSQPAPTRPSFDAGKVGEAAIGGENRRTRVRRRPHEACRSSPPHNADAASPKGSIGVGGMDDAPSR